MTHAARLRRSIDIAAVRAEGRTVRRSTFSVRALPSTGSTIRLAVTASRTVGRSVVRNRARRRVREAFRRAAASARPADVVVTVRRDAVSADFATLAHDALAALREIET